MHRYFKFKEQFVIQLHSFKALNLPNLVFGYFDPDKNVINYSKNLNKIFQKFDLEGEMAPDELLLTGFEKWTSYQDQVANAALAQHSKIIQAMNA